MRAAATNIAGTRRDRLRAFAVFLWRHFRDDRCFETAGALSYTTLFAIVPLLAAVFAVVSMVPVLAGLREHMSEFVFRSFVPAAGRSVQAYLVQFAGNASRLTVAGLAVLVITALLMMASIEDRFNRIWRVASRRKGSARFLLYWAALTLGPLLLAVGVGLSSWVYEQPLWRSVAHNGLPGFRLWVLAPFLITWVGLALLYELVPNCRVRWRHAVAGALAAAVLFEIARRGFVLYVAHFGNYREIYGALAAIPIFLIWIYLSWVIVLLGAIFTAALTSFEYRGRDELLPPGCEFVGLLRVLQRFAAAQRDGAAVSEAGLIAGERFLTADLLQRYLGELARTGLIRRIDGGDWVLARNLDAVRADDLLRAGGYRLPDDALALQRASVDLAPAARVLLQRAEAALRANLAVPLGALLCEAPPAAAADNKSRSS